jgi:DNA-binding NarL/FixJ family response regulator
VKTLTRPRFTPSQVAVVALVAQGMTNREAAANLGVPVTTVVNRLHCATLTSGMGTRAGLVARACRQGQLQSVPLQDAAPVDLPPALLDVLGLLAAGLTYREIGAVLFLSPDSIATRSQRLLRALGARDRAHAVLIAWQLRILPEVSR